jgi:hypothetical protein
LLKIGATSKRAPIKPLQQSSKHEKHLSLAGRVSLSCLEANWRNCLLLLLAVIVLQWSVILVHPTTPHISCALNKPSTLFLLSPDHGLHQQQQQYIA